MNKNKKSSKKQENKTKLINEDALDEIVSTNTNNIIPPSTNQTTENQFNTDDILKQLQGLMSANTNPTTNDNGDGENKKVEDMSAIFSQLENIIKNEIPKEELEAELAKINSEETNNPENGKNLNSKTSQEKKGDVKTYSITTPKL